MAASATRDKCNQAAPVDRLRSASPNGTAENMNGATEQESNERETDLDRIKDYLDTCNSRHLLDNIPGVDDMQFFDHSFNSTRALSTKLLVGYTALGNSIYAYMVLQQSNPQAVYMIVYYEETHSSKEERIGTKQIGQHKLLDPFSKIYPCDASLQNIGGHIANLSTMVKYYFVANGIAEGIVLNHASFLRRLKPALEFIATSTDSESTTEAGAVNTPEAIANGDFNPEGGAKQRTTGESPYFGESDITHPPARRAFSRPIPPRNIARKSAPSIKARKPTLLATLGKLGPSPRILNGSSFAYTAPPGVRHTPMSLPHTSTERTAEDAEFARLAHMSTKERDLMSQIDAIDRKLAAQKIGEEAFKKKQKEELQAFMEKLATETSTLKRKRGLIDTEIISLREEFKRPRCACRS
jgi:hypothetical protein